MSTYSFSTNPGFAGDNANITAITSDISGNILSGNVSGVSTAGDSIMITFDQTLSDDDNFKLQNIILAHDTAAPMVERQMLCSLVPRKNAYNAPLYVRSASFEYAGTLSMPPIYSISLLSYCDTGVASYSVRCVNISDSSVICEQTFSNHQESVKQFTSINGANLPQTISTIEVHIKTSGPSTLNAYIENVTIYL